MFLFLISTSLILASGSSSGCSHKPGERHHDSLLVFLLHHTQINTFLCIGIGFYIDKWGGPLLSVMLAAFHLGGAIVMAGSATNRFNSYPLLVFGKVLAAIGDGSLDNAQHRIFSTYFSPGKGFAFSIGRCTLLLASNSL
jgi:MFS family permease